MDYRQLGRTDLKVSSLCLGTMTWGEQNSADEAHAQIERAKAYGVNFLDTAEMYPVPPRAETYSKTEQIIGDYFKQRGDRADWVLASKIAGPGNGIDYIRGGQLKHNRAHIVAALDASLKRLQTDWIEPAKTRHIGLSNETPWGTMKFLQLAEQRGWPRMVSIQNPYNLLNRSFEVGLAEIAIREDCGLLAYSPLAFGMLSGKYENGARPAGARISLFSRFARYTNPESESACARYVALAREHGLDPAQMALAFVTAQPFVTSNIIGATSLEQLDSNLASSELRLSAEVLADIEAIHKAQPSPAP